MPKKNWNKLPIYSYNPDSADCPNISACDEEIEAHPDSTEWQNFFHKNLDTIDMSFIPKDSYTVMVRLEIDCDGKIYSAVVLNDPGYGLANKVINAISKYEGHWKPCEKLCGIKVKSYVNQPFTFIVD